MPKAARKNTTPAKRAEPDPIVARIDESDNVLTQYWIADRDLRTARERFQSATEDLERITKAIAKEKPTTEAGSMALLDYIWTRTKPSTQSIQCIRQDANLHDLLYYALAVLRGSKRGT
jgi:hypothetical protein